MAQRSLAVKTERQKEKMRKKTTTDIKYCTCTESTAPKTNTEIDCNHAMASTDV